MSLKEIRQRIQSVNNTQKITSVMKLVSASKLHRAQNRIENILPYKQKLNDMLVTLIANTPDIITPYTRISELRRVAVIAVSSNSSLCGAFNSNIIRCTKEVLREYHSLGMENIEVYAVGKKIAATLRKAGYSPREDLMPQATAPEYVSAAQVAYDLMNGFALGETDRIELVYTHFVSSFRQIPVRETLLPIDVTSYKPEKGGVARFDYIVEPSMPRLLERLLPKVTAMHLFSALLDSITAEHAARMLAMQVATDNADEILATLVREYNKGRQQAVTNELSDIMSGSVR